MKLDALDALYVANRNNPNYQFRDLTEDEFYAKAMKSYSKLTDEQHKKVTDSWMAAFAKEGKDFTLENTRDLIKFRFLAQTNLYFLCHLLETYNQTTLSTHEYICNGFFVQKDPTYATFEKFANAYTELKDRMLLVPRGGFKSSIDIADCVQWVMCFPAITILILTGVYELAGEFVGELRSHFTYDESTSEADPKTKKPKLIPRALMDKETGEWSQSLFQVMFPEHCIHPDEGVQHEYQTPALGTDKEPTVKAASIEQALVGQHFCIIKLDDVITNENTQTILRMQKINKFISIDRAMLHPYGFQDVIGTWYDERDFYGKRIKYEEDYAKKNGMLHLVQGSVDSGRLDIAVKMKVHLRSCWWLNDHAVAAGKSFDDALESDYILWFPERLSFSFLETERDSDPEGFPIKYLNNPRLNHRVKFDRALLLARTIQHTQLPPQGVVVTAIDTAYSTKSWADYTVILTAIIYGGRFYIINMVRGRFDENLLPIKIAEVAKKWQPKQMGIEESVGVKWLGKEVKREMQKAQISVPLQYITLGFGSKKTSKRIKAKPVRRLLGDERMFFANSCEGLEEIYTELEAFTGTEEDTHDDIVSALSLLVEQYGSYAEQGVQIDNLNMQFISDSKAHEMHLLVYGLGKYSRFNAGNYVQQEDDSSKTAFQLEENNRTSNDGPSRDPLADLFG